MGVREVRSIVHSPVDLKDWRPVRTIDYIIVLDPSKGLELKAGEPFSVENTDLSTQGLGSLSVPNKAHVPCRYARYRL